ncbi:MAG: hypothetical protein LC687_04640 [Actinobacteria bacterium]|nr:hypothetical protein [Actinomycetota bacterium]MCA1807121.1 hypothetical protein [Actinomycetota bacterium]
MNIFYLDHNPAEIPKYMSDAHVNKMILESAQMLSTTFWISTGIGHRPQALTQSERSELTQIANRGHRAGFYKPTHVNHPCSIWARTCRENAQWLLDHMAALNAEWQYRYGHTRNHKSWDTVKGFDLSLLPSYGEGTTHAVAMPLDYIVKGDQIQSYRNYYMAEKVQGAKFTKRSRPKFKTTNPL